MAPKSSSKSPRATKSSMSDEHKHALAVRSRGEPGCSPISGGPGGPQAQARAPSYQRGDRWPAESDRGRAAIRRPPDAGASRPGKDRLGERAREQGGRSRPRGSRGRVRPRCAGLRRAQGHQLQSVEGSRRRRQCPLPRRYRSNQRLSFISADPPSVANRLTAVQESETATPADRTSAPSRRSPSFDPVSSSLARSGWGISPTTFPTSLVTPAMSPSEPLGLSV